MSILHATAQRWRSIIVLALVSAGIGALARWISDIEPPHTGWFAGPTVALFVAIVLGCSFFWIEDEEEKHDA
jgi:hypothetical protein